MDCTHREHRKNSEAPRLRLIASLTATAVAMASIAVGAVVHAGAGPALASPPRAELSQPASKPELDKEWVWKRQPKRFDYMWQLPR